MKIALITDTHFGIRQDSVLFCDYIKKFYDNVFFPYLDEHKITTVIHLGDLVDRRKFVNYHTLFRMKQDFIKPLMDRNIDFHVIIGNHDDFFKTTNALNGPRELFDRYPINIYEKPKVVTFDGLQIAFMPWICDDTYAESIKLINETPAQVLFGHLDIAGYEMYRGSYSTDGQDKALFSRFDVVCSGHFHHRSASDNIHYLGSPYEFIWSDFDDARGFHIFDTELRSLQFIRNPYSIFHKLYYNDYQKDLDGVLYSDFEELKGCYVKVVVEHKGNPYWFDMFLDALDKANPADVQVIDEAFNFDLTDEEVQLETDDTLTLFKKYIKVAKVEALDKDKLENVFTELYLEAQNLE